MTSIATKATRAMPGSTTMMVAGRPAASERLVTIWASFSATGKCAAILVHWHGGQIAIPEGDRLRLRRSHPRHRRTGLPVLARGLPGSRHRAALRPLDPDRRLVDRDVRPQALS